jgi:thioredoxin-like negative regulator of GroEL
MAGLTIGKLAAGGRDRPHARSDRGRARGQVDVVKLNVDENPRTARRYGILHIPTMGLFRGGEVVKQVVGARSKSALLREFGEFF